MRESTEITIDPEVEEILRKVAADPGSILLRGSRPRSIKGLVSRCAGLSGQTTGLTAVERHLVLSQRHDVARLLREACRMKLVDPPGGPLDVNPYRTVHELHVRWNPAEVAERRRGDGPDVPTSNKLKTAWRLLDLCVGSPHGQTPSVVELAEASLRLESSDEARIMAALDLIISGSPNTGIQVLTHVLSAPTSSSVAVSARGNLGMAHSFLNDNLQALSHYSAACRLGFQCLDQSMNRLLFGLQVGQYEDSREAAVMIDEFASVSMAPVEFFADTRQLLRRRGEWMPSHASKKIIRRLDSSFGPASRRIASVFA